MTDQQVTDATHGLYKRVIMGYIVLALALAAGVWGMTERSEQSIKRDINEAATLICLQQRLPDSNQAKYNDFVDDQIQNIRETREINLRNGELDRVRSNTKSILRLQKDKIRIPSVADCKKELLK